MNGPSVNHHLSRDVQVALPDVHAALHDYGSRDDVYAAIAIMSSIVSFSTADFINADHGPFRAPCCRSNNCRTV
jgi:hypothetical protein